MSGNTDLTQPLSRKDFEAAVTSGGFTFTGKTSIIFPEDEGFAAATNRWNPHNAPSFFATISVGTEDDVATAVRLARHLDVPFLATSSRHGYGSTMSKLQNGLSIDLSQLNAVQIFETEDTMTIGPGATSDDVVGPVDKAGFEFPTGSCSTVSVIGVSLGAGVSRWSGVHGLVGDSLVSARVVGHDGEVVDASKEENPDLFWALRGAGANLGIVTSATYKLYKPFHYGKAMSIDIVLPLSQQARCFDLLESIIPNQPKELAMAMSFIWHPDAQTTVLGLNFVWFGSEESGRAFLSSFLLMESIVTNVASMAWKDITKAAFFGFDAMATQKGTSRSIYSVNLRKLDAATCDSTVKKMVQFFDDFPEGRQSAAVIEMFPDPSTETIQADAMAYPWRDSKVHIMFQFTQPEGAADTQVASSALARELRRDFAATSGFDGLAVYVNYAYGDEELEEIYGKDQLPRLAQLKKRWDPSNVFKWHHALPRA